VRETAKLDLRNIDKLHCFQCQIKRLGGIEAVENLLNLDLHMNEVTNGAPIAELRWLKELHLGLNQCNDLTFLAEMQSLRSLTLFDNDIEELLLTMGC
jgi:Leucine-rich repeat (LRR) protein